MKNILFIAHLYVFIFLCLQLLKSSTSSTTITSCGISGNWGNVFDSSDLQTESSQSSEGGLCSWSGGLGIHSSSSSKLDVDSVNMEFIESLYDIIGSHHSSIWGWFFSVSLNLHTSCNSNIGFSAGEIGDMDECIVPGGEDVSNTEN